MNCHPDRTTPLLKVTRRGNRLAGAGIPGIAIGTRTWHASFVCSIADTEGQRMLDAQLCGHILSHHLGVWIVTGKATATQRLLTRMPLKAIGLTINPIL